jgi:hypothetical protein
MEASVAKVSPSRPLLLQTDQNLKEPFTEFEVDDIFKTLVSTSLAWDVRLQANWPFRSRV